MQETTHACMHNFSRRQQGTPFSEEQLAAVLIILACRGHHNRGQLTHAHVFTPTISISIIVASSGSTTRRLHILGIGRLIIIIIIIVIVIVSLVHGLGIP